MYVKVERIIKMFRKLMNPIIVQWEVTPDCNYKCIHCYNSWRKSDISKNFDKIDYIYVTKQIIASKVLHVTITGGEPLLVFDELIPCIEMLVSNGITVSINTNASCITENMSKRIKELGVSSVLISLTSGIEEHCNSITQNAQAFNMTMKGINNLIKYKNKVLINMVITNSNIMDIYDTAKLFVNLPIAKFSATKASTPCEYNEFGKYRINIEQFEFMFDELLRVKKDFNIDVGTYEFYPYCSFKKSEHFIFFGRKICSAGKLELAISYDGTIKACPHSNLTYGDYKDGLKKAWDKMDAWRNADFTPPQCQQCKYAMKCAGGCKEEAYNAYNNYQTPDPFSKPQCLFDFEISEKVFCFNDKTEFIISPNIKIRDEENFSLLYLSAAQWIPVNMDFAHSFIMNKTITIDKICRLYNISDIKAKNLMKLLLKKGFIKERNNINE